MIGKTTKLRWRRSFKRQKQQVEILSQKADNKLDRLFFKRLSGLIDVRRFVISWVLLIILAMTGVWFQFRSLPEYYKSTVPTEGGIYTEGVLGAFTTANPVYATGPVDSAVARLAFSGLMEYDSKGALTGELAEQVTPNDKNDTYTVKLKDNIYWHDGKKITAKDIVFTYQLIQNPDSKSPLRSNWQGVKITASNDRTIVFALPHPLVSFPHSLTTGIVPEHLLKDIAPSQLRTASFNTVNPVGSGPFKWESLVVKGQNPENREELVGLIANEGYFKGRPKIDRMIIRAVHDENKLLELFNDNQLTAASGLDNFKNSIKQDNSPREYSTNINGQIMVFFKTTQGDLADVKVRQALVRATNKSEMVTSLGYSVALSNSPFLRTHIGYNKDLAQAPYNGDEANRLLDEAGWKKDDKGMRFKDGRPLKFKFYAQKTNDFESVAKNLQKQWKIVGIDAEVNLLSPEEIQPVISDHNYDALLYGIELGVDPDVYAYWHSSQADPRSANRLNFSEYKNGEADLALASGRSRGGELRAVKYQPFLKVWKDEAPALALYQPRFYFVTKVKIYGFSDAAINTPTDRYNNVENWQINTKQATIK